MIVFIAEIQSYEQDLMQSLALIYLGLNLHSKSKKRESSQI